MIPRFSNPHFLLQTKVVTREELDAEDEKILKDSAKEDSRTIEQLRLLDNSLPTWDVSDIRSSKRRKIEKNDQVGEEPVLFRLISSTLPALPVSWLPPPLPPSITREPDAEENESQADRRRMRAEAVAINGEDILSSIGSMQAPDLKKYIVLRAVASIPDPEPYLMIIQRQQPSRKTRPPVHSSKLLHHPYISSASTELSPSSANCPIIKVQSEAQAGSTPRKGRRHRRWKEALRAKERPLPQYYRPNPGWEGKCRGYGYGY